MKADAITTIAAKGLCTSCGVCAGRFPDLIDMVDDPVKGRVPRVKPSFKARQAAQDAAKDCAGTATNWKALAARDEIDAAWGPVLAAWEGWAADPEIRYRGSSGGGVTALSVFALKNGTATGVAHVVARAEDPRLNQAVISRDRAGLLRGAGSRYAPASPGEALAEISSEQDRIVFVGKPCDVASVHAGARSDKRLGSNIALTISIFCAGTPSTVATDHLLDRLGVPKAAKITELRYRGNGWPGLMQAKWRDALGAERASRGISYAEGWGQILQAYRGWRCRICSDHTGAFADISIGDPWHRPPSADQEPGRSLIIARTARGRALIEAAICAGDLVATPMPRDVIARAQPNLSATHGAVWGRRLALRALNIATPKDRGQKLFRLWRRLSIRAKMGSVLGTWKRLARDKLRRRRFG